MPDKIRIVLVWHTTISCGAVKKTNQYIDIKQLTRALMRVIMNVLAIAICQGVIRLDFSKNLHGKLPFLCPKTIKRQNLAPFLSFVKNRFIGSLVRIRATHSVIARSVATWQSPGRDTE